MEFGVLFTSHPNPRKKLPTPACRPYPRVVEARDPGVIAGPPAGAASRGGGVTPARRSNLSLGALYTVLAMLGFAGMDAMSKWLVADYAISQMMWIRYGVFCLFAWLVVRRTGLRAAFRTRRPWLQAARSVLAVIESAIFVLAFKYLPLADAHAIAATAPLIVIAFGVLFLGERAGVARWLAVAAGFLGVLLIVHPGLQDARLAIAAAARRRLHVGRLSDPGAAVLARGLGRNDPGLVGVRRLRRDHAGRAVPVAMAGRLQRDPARGHRAPGRAGALCADQGARPCRGKRRAALQLHPAGLGHDSGRPGVRRHSRPLDLDRRRHHRRQRSIHLAPRPADRTKNPSMANAAIAGAPPARRRSAASGP